jgi:hypothetical protein
MLILGFGVNFGFALLQGLLLLARVPSRDVLWSGYGSVCDIVVLANWYLAITSQRRLREEF